MSDPVMKALEDGLKDLHKTIGGRVSAAEDELKCVNENLRDLMQKQHGYTSGRGDFGRNTIQRLGSVVESDQVKALLSNQATSARVTLDGMDIKSTITGDSGTPATPDDHLSPASRVPGIVSGAVRRLGVADIIPTVSVTSNQAGVTVESSFTNATEGQEFEGDTKAESVMTFDLVQKPIITLATFVKASTQVLSDAPALQTYINTRLAHFLRVRLEHEILNGDNSAGQFDGLMRSANHDEFTPTAGDTELDSLRKAVEQVQLNDYAPTHVILHPTDWRRIELQKADESTDLYTLGHADGARYVAAGMGPRLWNLEVVLSRSIDAGKFILGEFGAACMLFDRMSPTIEIGYTNDDFVKNLVVVRGEMRAALGVAVPDALTAGDLLDS